MRSTAERRQAILEYLCEKRHDTRANLIFEFGVSKNTIDRDLQLLACSYPIYTTQGNGGGVHVIDGYKLGRKYMTKKQTELLERIGTGLSGDDYGTLQSILKVFKEPQKSKTGG